MNWTKVAKRNVSFNLWKACRTLVLVASALNKYLQVYANFHWQKYIGNFFLSQRFADLASSSGEKISRIIDRIACVERVHRKSSRTKPVNIEAVFQWWCLLGNHNHQAKPHTRSPAAYCLSNDVSVWVAPAFIKSSFFLSSQVFFWLDKGWDNPDRNVVAKTLCCWWTCDLLDDRSHVFPPLITHFLLFVSSQQPLERRCPHGMRIFILSKLLCFVKNCFNLFYFFMCIPGTAGLEG